MKKHLTLFLAAVLLLQLALPCASAKAAEEASQQAVLNDFIGVINIFSENTSKLTWDAVLRDEKLILMRPADIASIAGADFQENGTSGCDISRGCYRVHIDYTAKTADVYVDMRQNCSPQPYDGTFSLLDTGSVLFDREAETVVPLEQILYLLNVQWKCLDGWVYTFTPKETLWNIVGELDQTASLVPTAADVVGTGGMAYANAAGYGVVAFLSNMELKYFLPLQTEKLFEEDMLTDSLLLLGEPCKNVSGSIYDSTIYKLDACAHDVSGFVNNVSNVVDLATSHNSIESIKDFLCNFTAWNSDSASQVLKGATWGSNIADVYLTASRANAWNSWYVNSLDYLSTMYDPSYKEYSQTVNDLAGKLYGEYGHSIRTAAQESASVIASNAAEDLTALLPPGKVFLAYKAGIGAASKVIPWVGDVSSSSTSAYLAKQLSDISLMLYSRYSDALHQTAAGITPDSLALVRQTSSLLSAAAAHCFDEVYSFKNTMYITTNGDQWPGQARVEEGLAYHAAAQIRLTESEQYDPSLILYSDFHNLHSETAGAYRMEIPPEYVRDNIPVKHSSCIAEYGNTIYCIEEVPGSGFTQLSVKPAEYAYYLSDCDIIEAYYDPAQPDFYENPRTVVTVDGGWSKITAITSQYLYYEREKDNTSSLWRYDIRNKKTDMLDSQPAAGGGGYFNW